MFVYLLFFPQRFKNSPKIDHHSKLCFVYIKQKEYDDWKIWFNLSIYKIFFLFFSFCDWYGKLFQRVQSSWCRKRWKRFDGFCGIVVCKIFSRLDAFTLKNFVNSLTDEYWLLNCNLQIERHREYWNVCRSTAIVPETLWLRKAQVLSQGQDLSQHLPVFRILRMRT